MSVLVALLQTFRTWAPSRAALQLEVLALRHQLHVLQRSRPRRLRLADADRWLWVVLSRVLTGWRTTLVIVKPETVWLANSQSCRKDARTNSRAVTRVGTAGGRVRVALPR